MQCCSTDLSKIALKFTDQRMFLPVFRAGRLRLTESMFFSGSTYYFAFQQFYPQNNYLLNVFSISDVNDLPFAVVLYVDGMMTAMLIGCVFRMLEKNGKIVLALILVGVNAVWGSGVFEIEKHNAFTSFLLGIESMIKGMNPVYPAIIYAIVSISLCLLVIKRFKLRFE
ncbi:hypothetical protein LRB_1296 [Ligilactobacillus ruminis]|uniref:Uncharacterized protein n=3 Tax=Ligilactobacillus ruminis TaxID=1623 RepID=A0A837IRI7_9LACO|nr:hypothetical protein LRB_1296 [Ligilactobacillus ruminis]